MKENVMKNRECADCGKKMDSNDRLQVDSACEVANAATANGIPCALTCMMRGEGKFGAELGQVGMVEIHSYDKAGDRCKVGGEFVKCR